MDELRDRYHVGHHPPGHLADDEPACFDEWWLAANYLLVLMQEYADADDEAAYVVIGNSPAPRELLLDNGYAAGLSARRVRRPTIDRRSGYGPASCSPSRQGRG